MSRRWRRVRQVRRTRCLQIGDRRSHAGCLVFEKSHTPIAFVAKEPADQAGCVTVIHAKGARRLLFADGAHAVLLCQESVVFLQRNSKMVLETKATSRPARSLKLSFVKLCISRVPVPLAGVNLFPCWPGNRRDTLQAFSHDIPHLLRIGSCRLRSFLNPPEEALRWMAVHGRLQMVRAIFSSERPPT
jgi:hypothetical protein